MRDGGTVPMLEERPLLMLMDGHAMVHRAWHAIRTPLNVSSTGEEVRAVYGFLNTFLRSLGDWNPTHCAIAFDLPGPTFRHRQFREYKAHRPPSPPELRGQFGRIRKLMEAFGVPIFDMDGYEADDILGALCLQSEQQEMEALILTGDTDTLQLVSPWVRVLLGHGVQGRTVYDVPAVRERYGGLGPEAIPDIKALEGDTSDNIPGVPGVGAKTAIRLLTEFGSVEGIYDNLSDIRPPRLQKLLTDNRDLALQGKALTTIVRDTPVTLDLEAARFWSYERSAVVDLLRELEFFTVVPRIPFPGADSQIAMDLTGEARDDKVETDYTMVDTERALDEMIDVLDTPSGFSFDTETTTLSPTDSGIVGISFSNAPGRAWYVPVGHDEGKQLPLDYVMERTRPLFEGGLPKSAHNANYDLTVLSRYGITVRNLSFDSMLAAHVSGTKSIGLKALALDRLNEEMKQITDLIGTGRKQLTMDRVPISDTADYACADADFTQRLVAVLGDELEDKGIRELFDEVEMPLVPVLVRMQLDGVSLDVPMLERLSQGLRDRMARIEARMYETVGHEFNLNSSQQLGDVLFKEFRLPPTKRRQKGFSTDASSLEGLKALIERGEAEGVDPRSPQVLDSILEYRQIAKIKSTYADSLPSLVNPKTGRVHTSYNQTGSATGRVSSNDPNVQNIPVRTELGMRVREAFVAENAPEWTLLAADYSQIELRILAHMSRDPGLLRAFHDDEDIHDATASSVYGVPIDEVTSDMRRVAKIMNFGVLYGLSAYGISRQTDLGPDEGARFIETYFGMYPGIRTYVDETKRRCREVGYVETLRGRRRYLPEIASRNFHVRGAAERAAINMPIQGTAADIIKIAMIRLQERIDSQGLESRMILQVHDELIFEVPGRELAQMRAEVMDVMPSAMDLAVPLRVELKTGPNWAALE